FDFHLILCVRPSSHFERTIERDAKLVRRGRPGLHRLGQVASAVMNLEETALAGGTGAPVGRPAMTSDEEIALRRHACINREQTETGDQMLLRHISERRFSKFRPPNFAPRFTADERISLPMRRTEDGAAIDRFIKN